MLDNSFARNSIFRLFSFVVVVILYYHFGFFLIRHSPDVILHLCFLYVLLSLPYFYEDHSTSDLYFVKLPSSVLLSTMSLHFKH